METLYNVSWYCKGGIFIKRFGNLFDKICDYNNIYEAYRRARAGKHKYASVRKVDANPSYYCHLIQDMLKNKTYKVSPYRKTVLYDKGKVRMLAKLPFFPDRIIQWAIMLPLESIFMKTFIHTTCASLTGRGCKHLWKFMRRYIREIKQSGKPMYCLKLDIRKFYYNIDHEILKKLLRKKFKDKDLLELLDIIIDSNGLNIGLPIGSYLSQYLANFYMSYFDHFIKEDLKCKYYIRYMDDAVILGSDKEWLHDCFNKIRIYTRDNLRLSIKDNWQVFPVEQRGVDFGGYRFFPDFILLRKRTAIKFKKRMLDIKEKIDRGITMSYSDWCSINSYRGWLKWCDSDRLLHKYYFPVKAAADQFYKDNFKKKKKRYKVKNYTIIDNRILTPEVRKKLDETFRKYEEQLAKSKEVDKHE